MDGAFGYANVGNFGLGHSLLAWARCHLWCDQNQVPMLAPSWLHLRGRIGPLLRRERDNRQYHRLFWFPDYVTGVRRLYLLSRLKRIEAEVPNFESSLRSGDKRLVVFSNLMDMNEETYYPQIVGQGLKLRRALIAMTKPIYLPKPPKGPHIALHVRMGDFTSVASIDILRSGAKNSRIPLSWYCDMLDGLRREVGQVPAILYSDGSDEALTELLARTDVVRPPKQASVTDMLAISQASVVISSGSGFSAWGTYLANCPRVCFPGQRFARVLGEPGSIDLEPAVERASELEQLFLASVRQRLTT